MKEHELFETLAKLVKEVIMTTGKGDMYDEEGAATGGRANMEPSVIGEFLSFEWAGKEIEVRTGHYSQLDEEDEPDAATIQQYIDDLQPRLKKFKADTVTARDAAFKKYF